MCVGKINMVVPIRTRNYTSSTCNVALHCFSMARSDSAVFRANCTSSNFVPNSFAVSCDFSNFLLVSANLQ